MLAGLGEFPLPIDSALRSWVLDAPAIGIIVVDCPAAVTMEATLFEPERLGAEEPVVFTPAAVTDSGAAAVLGIDLLDEVLVNMGSIAFCATVTAEAGSHGF